MADKIENKDLFAKDAFSKTQKDVEDLIGVIDDLNKSLIDLSKAQKEVLNKEDGKTFKSLKNINQAVETLNKAEQESTAILKEKLKLENRLAQAKNEDAKINTELKVLLQEQNKLNKEAAKESLGLTDAYQKQSKRLNLLRKQYKSLVVEEGKATKESKKLLREIKKLDKELKDVDESAGQFQRNVGNYPETFGAAAKSAAKLAAGFLSIKAASDGVSGSLNDTVEGSENVREVTSKLGGVFDQVKNVVAGTALDLFDYGKAVVQSVQGGEGLIDSLTEQEDQFKRTDEATTDFGDKVKQSADSQEALTKRIIEFEKASRPLEVRLSKLNGLIEQQAIIAGDSTRSFNEISNAILKGQDLQVKRANINVKLAKEELEITQERVRIANLAGGAGVELLDQETQAIRALIDAENELKNEVLENEKELRQVKQDRLEIDLDILIDGFDNQKTINERIIANEKETLETRAALLEKTNRLAEESFRGQKEVLAELSAAGLNIDDLLLLDATELAKQIQLLEQSEIINTRTLEVIRERRIVIQDLEEAQQDLNESEQESLDLRADILAQEEALGKQSVDSIDQSNQAIEDLEKDRFENEKSNIQRRLDNVKEGSIEELRLRKELNDLLLTEAEENNKEQEELEKKSNEERKEIVSKSIEVLNDLINKGFEKRLESIGASIEKTGERIDQLRSKANEGQLDAQESLAFEQKKEAELERERERTRKNQERTKAFFAVLSSFNSNDGDLAKTIADVSVLKALAGGLTAFDGVDDTGGRGDLDSKGGKAWILHPNEQVWSKKDRGEVGFRSREEMKDIVKMYDNGVLTDIMKYDKSNDLINTNSFALNGMGNSSQIVSKLNQLNQSIKGIDIPEGTVNIDEVRGFINLVSRKGNKKITERSKLHK